MMRYDDSSFEALHSKAIFSIRIRVAQFLLALIGIGAAIILLVFAGTGSIFDSFLGFQLFSVFIFAAILFVLITRRIFETTISHLIAFFLVLVSFIVPNGSIEIVILLVVIASLATALIVQNNMLFILFIVGIGLRLLWLLSYSVADLDSSQTEIGVYLGLILFDIVSYSVPIVIAALVYRFINNLQAALSNAQRSANLLEASAIIGQSMSQMLELRDLLNRAVEIIRDRFAFYHVSIFLLDDERRYAHLTASTGEVGEKMLARNHRLTLDASSIVGRVAQAGDIIVARDTERDSGHSFNELLPDTRSELAVPIMDNDGIIGVVDVQSRRIDAYTPTEIQALRVIANQLATAIRNARLFEEKEVNIRENKRLFIESETNLREIQRLNRQLTKQAWSDYLKADRRIDGVTLQEQRFSNTAEWSDQMLNASRRRRPISSEVNGKHLIAVPIELRGEVVGAIEIETAQDLDQEDTIDMIRAISQRLAVSLDNARLFEESTEATAQEQRIGEIVSLYQSVNTVDELLQVTLQGLAETLGAEQGSIRLGMLPDAAFSPASLTQTIETSQANEDEG